MSDVKEWPLTEYIQDQIWLKEYPIIYAGTKFNSRMTVVRMNDARLMLHSPCNINAVVKAEIDALGEVAYIVVPGSYHYFYVESAQAAFPDAQTYICPGIEKKCPDLVYDAQLGSRSEIGFESGFDQVLVRGSRFIWEVTFFHKSSRTLILVDLLENITDQTPGTNWLLKLWFKYIFRMWGNPKPAPEYQLGWQDKRVACESLKEILKWDFERIIIAHGDLIENNAREVLLTALRNPLKYIDQH